MTRGATTASIVALLLLGLSQRAIGHGVQVRRCITEDGMFRFFIETWHAPPRFRPTTNTNSGTMTMVKDLPLPSYGLTAYPDGFIQDQPTSATTNYANNGQPVGGWGCVNDLEPEYVKGCSSHQDRYNYWIYYQIPAVCEVPVQFTIYSGNTIVLTEACSTLYPAVVTDTIPDMIPPAPYLDNVRLPFDSTDASVPVIEIPLPHVGATHAYVYHSDLGTITAKDDCDPNPTWEIDTSMLADGQDIPVGSPHLVRVDATDWQSKMGSGYIKVLIVDAPTASPAPPTPPPTTTPSISLSPSLSLGPSQSVGPSINRKPSAEPSRSAVPSTSLRPSGDPTSSPTAIWCPDWSGSNTGCTGNCPSWMHDMGYSYLAIEDCCNTWYGTDLNQCLRKEDPVDGAVEGGWYVNWQKYYCVQSCRADYFNPLTSTCGGIARSWEHLFDDVRSCCSNMLGHQDTDLCVLDSSHRDHDHYTDKYYVNHRNMQCVKDCDESTSGCGGSPYDITVELYDSQAACCANELPWLSSTECIEQSSVIKGGDSQMWFREELNTVNTMSDVWLGGNISPFRHEEDLPGWPSTANPTTQTPTQGQTAPPSHSPSSFTSSTPTASPSRSPSIRPTRSPVTQSPTTSPTTASPTKSPVIVLFTEEGDGHCLSSSGDKYEYVAYQEIEFDICPGVCMALDNGGLVGYDHYAYNITAGPEPDECRCLFDNGNMNLPDPWNATSDDITLEATGAIASSDNEAGWKCHSLDSYDPAQVKFSFVAEGFCRDMTMSTYGFVKIGSASDPEGENAARCPSLCLSLSNSTTDLVGYYAATRILSNADDCWCYFAKDTVPDPCPDIAEECKYDPLGQYAVRDVACSLTTKGDCYRYNAFDVFDSDGDRTAFDLVTQKYKEPEAGLCVAAADDKLFHEFEEGDLFINGEDGERTCYEYCEPYEGVDDDGYVGFGLDLLAKKCICYFQDSTTFPSTTFPPIPPTGSATTMSSDPGSAPAKGKLDGNGGTEWSTRKMCYIYEV